MRRILIASTLAATVLATLSLDAQVTYDRLLNAAKEPQNWLSYSGSYMSQRYSPLTQLNATNVKNLEQKWVLQNRVFGAWQSTPLVVDGVMYLTQRPNDVIALDAKTGRVFWTYRHDTSPDQKACCGANNRGVAILGDSLFMGTLDGYLLSLDAHSGKLLWREKVAEMKAAYSITDRKSTRLNSSH